MHLPDSASTSTPACANLPAIQGDESSQQKICSRPTCVQATALVRASAPVQGMMDAVHLSFQTC